MILIRRSTPDDASQIAAFSRQSFYDSFARFNTKENMQLFMDGPFNTAKLEAEASDPSQLYLLAEENGKLVGYLLMKDSTEPALANYEAIEVSRIYVDHAITGKGIGKLLLDTSIDKARELKKNCIWLGVWEHNTKAIAFYEREGFEKFGEHIFLLGEDPQTDWLMKKLI
ncbi:MAG: GNAT family N-acetyltransferase [Chitinophagaceae bacterium]|nr:GNAT family N-acetyltransferase [Chitinophagaceae bacterium]